MFQLVHAMHGPKGGSRQHQFQRRDQRVWKVSLGPWSYRVLEVIGKMVKDLMQLMWTLDQHSFSFSYFYIILVFAGYHLEQLFLGILFEKTGALGSSQVFQSQQLVGWDYKQRCMIIA